MVYNINRNRNRKINRNRNFIKNKIMYSFSPQKLSLFQAKIQKRIIYLTTIWYYKLKRK